MCDTGARVRAVRRIDLYGTLSFPKFPPRFLLKSNIARRVITAAEKGGRHHIAKGEERDENWLGDEEKGEGRKRERKDV